VNGWCGAALLPLVCSLSGCYRYAEIPVEDVKHISPEGEESLYVHRLRGHPLVYDRYDTLEVHTREAPGYEYERPVSARRRANLLQVADLEADRTFRIEEVEALELSAYAPERPWLVAAIATGATIAGGFIGYQAGGLIVGCDSSHELCGLALFAGLVIGGSVGLGTGLAIGIPATSHLEPATPESPDTE